MQGLAPTGHVKLVLERASIASTAVTAIVPTSTPVTENDKTTNSVTDRKIPTIQSDSGLGAGSASGPAGAPNSANSLLLTGRHGDNVTSKNEDGLQKRQSKPNSNNNSTEVFTGTPSISVPGINGTSAENTSTNVDKFAATIFDEHIQANSNAYRHQ